MLSSHASIPVHPLFRLIPEISALVASCESKSTHHNNQALSWDRSDDGYSLSLDVPGVAPDAINVQLQENRLVATFESPKEVGGRRLVARLPRDADASTLNASLSRGVLTLSLAAIPEPQPRTIEVREIQEVPLMASSPESANVNEAVETA